MNLIRLLFICSIIALASTTLHAQDLSKFEQELQTHNYSFALAVPSSALEEYPLFSPDQKFIAFNVDGGWRKISLSKMQLTGATWLRMHIGYPEAEVIKNWYLKKKEFNAYKEATKYQPQKLVLSNGTVIEFKSEGLGTSLYITPKGSSARKIWTTGMEPCNNLAVGANENLIAFICPMSGILIMHINRTLKEFPPGIDSSSNSKTADKEEHLEEQKGTEYILAALRAAKAKETDLTEQGEILVKEGKPEEAIKLLERALLKNPHNAKTYLNLGYAYSSLGKHDKALEHFTTANNMEPSQDGFFNLGSCNLLLHNLDEAIKHLSKAIAMEKEDYEAYQYRAISYMLNGNTEKACEDYYVLKKVGFRGLSMKQLRKGCK